MTTSDPGAGHGKVKQPRYRVIRELGQGGMGVVYAARDAVLERTVALKVLRRFGATDPSALRRFRREVHISQQLRHPHVIRIFDAGELEGAPFFTMELLEAVTLEALIGSQGPLKPARAATLACQLLEALAYCHENGLVHRDLKPANVMVRPGDDAVLMDFGLAKSVDATLLTVEGSALGTPRYMAPELVRGGIGDARSDIWAAGVVLYEMLTRRQPFRGVSIPDLVRSILTEPPPPLDEHAPGIAPALGALVLALLEKDPARRIPTAREAAARLEEWRDEDASASLIASTPDHPPFVPAAPAATVLPATKGTGVWVAATAVCAALIVVVYLLSPSATVPPAPVASSAAERSPAVSAFTLVAGATLVTVAFDAEPARAYRIEIVRAADGIAVCTAASIPGGQVRRATLTGLSPSTAHVARVRAPDGAVLAEGSFVTTSPREAALRLTARLERLDPYGLEREITGRYLDFRYAAARDPTLRARVDEMVRSWSHRVQDALRQADVATAAADFANLADELYGSPALTGLEKRQLYTQVQEVVALEDVLQRAGVQMPSLSAPLQSFKYGQLTTWTGICDPAVALVNQEDRSIFPGEAGAGPGVSLIPGSLAEQFKAAADLRDAKQRRSLFAGFTHTEQEYPATATLPARPPASTLQLRAAIEGFLPGGMRVFTRDAAAPESARWTLLAWLRSTPRKGRRVIAHGLPANALGPGSFRLRVELGFSALAQLDASSKQQHAWIKWLMLGWAREP